MLKVINVVGARPNFMKVAPVVEAMGRRAGEFAPLVVHTGQHYDAAMSDAFFRDLGLPRPDVHLGVGSGSRDRTMPEEINRLLTDQIADLLLTPSADADRNLLAEGIPAERIRMVGNVMIDSLFAQLERARSSAAREDLGVSEGEYAVVTLHR